MKSVASAHGILAPLDVLHVLQGSGMVYAVTLMAFSGVHGKKELVRLLLDEGASEY